MFVIKRNSDKEEVSFDKITRRISNLCKENPPLDPAFINPIKIAQETIQGLYDGITTGKLDGLSADICASKIQQHPDFGKLASRIVVSNLHKQTESDYLQVVKELYCKEIVSQPFLHFVEKYHLQLQEMINYQRDYNFDFFGFKTLERSYLHKIDNRIVERPQHVWMRVAIQIHGLDKDKIRENVDLNKIKITYDLVSEGYFTHATPTLFNSGSKRPQLSSCFLASMDDNIENIFKTIGDLAQISKWAGGIGVHISSIRSKGSLIKGTNGKSDGIIPLCKVLEGTARYINQCFVGDTIVFGEKGPVEMKNIKEGDKLITVDGTLRKVNKVIKNKVEKEIYEINIANSFETVKVTGEHEIFVIPDQPKIRNFKLIKNRIEKEIVKPIYKSVSELNTNDIVCFPLPEGLNKKESKDSDFFRLYGILLGDGHITLRKNKDSQGEFGVSLNNTSKSHIKNFVKKYLISKDIHYWENNDSIRWTYNEDNLIKINITFQDLYDEERNKRISERYINLGVSDTSKLLRGLIETDGNIGKEIYFCTSSRILAYQIRFMLYKNGVLCSGNIRDRIGEYHEIEGKGSITTRKLNYVIRIPKHPFIKNFIDNVEITGKLKYFELDEMIYGRISSINKINYSGDVYDFNMEENHNYLTNMGIVHNSGKRLGSIAVYLEPHHPDIEDFIDLRKNTGDENLRARDLFLALWISDLFMKRVQADEEWSLMSSDDCPGLNDTYGEEYERLYLKYEDEGKYRKRVRALELWRKILESQIETGMPYILFKDHVNRKSNQQNLGVIKSSNLCAEIIQYSDKSQTAVCNLASICLPKFVNKESKTFDYQKLGEVAEIATENLNRVIDVNFYPIPEAEYSNFLNRPIGLGVQGLADVYCLFKVAFSSEEARILNRKIFETIYYHSLKKSIELAKRDGPYNKFYDSPFSKGIVQWMMWGIQKENLLMNFDWDSLIHDLKIYGARNSLLTALMPTASTSQIMGNNECMEPYSSNLYVRTTLAGSYTVINNHLMRDLINLGLWNQEMFEEILYFNGSIQNIKDIPDNLKDIYKTAFELKGKDIVQQAIERGPFIDQTQSMNLFQAVPDFEKLSASHFYSWKNGLKTGMYYLRTQPAADPIKFGLDPHAIQRIRLKYKTIPSPVNKPLEMMEEKVCKRRKPGVKIEDCDVCSS
jgi:ribonucleoside-diphosphate reductase alpha chain